MKDFIRVFLLVFLLALCAALLGHLLDLFMDNAWQKGMLCGWWVGELYRPLSKYLGVVI
ncbi:hypothetical protein C8N40_111113 [Pontibacter mucosus]|uniref:Uncharacterized protein n=1 Tax=Pontibacter mucosus TaxID=1649266 RepID=A0A2T5YD44_9BACT|nr:hypothetical protein [Pontibacter mucosus]PTX14448.1 hypothetical protein C8N40_111113 [Pontibacter mucosus]